ncbi:hypothetical protein ADIWIN_2217 [Winogradskyella psychrotolerans RS-3]|uniref:Uncharacterized protein n=1 Tax=Winogradskyella psychrotolerans RS-3 TaxID=641526 RepID=S7X1I4_9FLAO|nr:hypothetical protein ADIWIN_2217 [Winogradskyella psychrotolerans RS-3]
MVTLLNPKFKNKSVDFNIILSFIIVFRLGGRPFLIMEQIYNRKL